MGGGSGAMGRVDRPAQSSWPALRARAAAAAALTALPRPSCQPPTSAAGSPEAPSAASLASAAATCSRLTWPPPARGARGWGGEGVGEAETEAGG
jgi:hypothetical protein